LVTGEKRRQLDLLGWSELARLGGTNAISGLSEMVNQEMKVTALSLEEVSMASAASLIGEPEDVVIGIYLMFTGNATGHIMLAFQPQIAFALVDMAMDLPSGTTRELGDMELSALGEVGNVVGSFFLNAVADDVGIMLAPSPPAVVADMAGSLIGSVLAEAWGESESVIAIRLMFTTPDREIEGRFLVLPNFDSQGVPE